MHKEKQSMTTLPCPAVTDHHAFVQAETPGATSTETAEHVLVFCPECNDWYLLVHGGVHENQAFRLVLKRMVPLATETEQLVDEAFARMHPIYRPTY